jgi:hypothetical protein
VAEVSKPGANAFKVANGYLAQLGAARALMGKTLTAEETGRIQDAVGRAKSPE